MNTALSPPARPPRRVTVIRSFGLADTSTSKLSPVSPLPTFLTVNVTVVMQLPLPVGHETSTPSSGISTVKSERRYPRETVISTVSPRVTSVPGSGFCAETWPSGTVLDRAGTTLASSPACSSSLTARPSASPRTRGTAISIPAETTTVTVEPTGTSSPAAGSWSTISPTGSLEAAFSVSHFSRASARASMPRASSCRRWWDGRLSVGRDPPPIPFGVPDVAGEVDRAHCECICAVFERAEEVRWTRAAGERTVVELALEALTSSFAANEKAALVSAVRSEVRR